MIMAAAQTAKTTQATFMTMGVSADARMIVIATLVTTTKAPVQYKIEAIIAARFLDAELNGASRMGLNIGIPNLCSMSAMANRMNDSTNRAH